MKGDMIYTVGFHRLDLIRLRKKDKVTGKRLYFKQKLGRDQMREIYKCALHGINLGGLGEPLNQLKNQAIFCILEAFLLCFASGIRDYIMVRPV